ncbi:hypothetical protein [Agathobaculum hominis]
MDNQTLNRLNNLQQNLSRQTDIQNMLNAANLQSQIPVPSEAMQNALAAANRMSEIANAENNPLLSEEVKDTLLELSTDPTGLKPYMGKQIEQNDTHTEQIEHLKAALQKQIEQNDTHTQQIEQLQAALQKQILDAAEERRLREIADKDEHQFTLKWNWRNLTVAIAGVLFGLAGFVVGLLALLATH